MWKIEAETITHLFFECVVANQLWEVVSQIFHVQIGNNFESVTRWWINKNRNELLNMFSSAIMWSMWSLRNDLCFQGKSWLGMKMVWDKVIAHLRR